MNNRNTIIATIFLALASFSISCLKTEECTYNVFENEELFMEVNIDGQDRFVSDYASKNILPGINYELDTVRADTIIFHFDCNYFFEDGEEIISIRVKQYADFSEVVETGYGNLNYLKFDSLMFEGDYEFKERTSYIPEHGVDVVALFNDTLQFYLDQSPDNPEDFYFRVDGYVKREQKDCYNRRFEWFTYSGTFGCRLVAPLSGDTIVIKDGKFSAIAAQYR